MIRVVFVIVAKLQGPENVDNLQENNLRYTKHRKSALLGARGSGLNAKTLAAYKRVKEQQVFLLQEDLPSLPNLDTVVWSALRSFDIRFRSCLRQQTSYFLHILVLHKLSGCFCLACVVLPER